VAEGKTTVALVAWAAGAAQLVEAALAGEGLHVVRVPLDADTVRTLGRLKPDVLAIEAHAFLDAPALLHAIHQHVDLAQARIVLVGPQEPIEVPGVEVVQQPGRALDLDRLLDAIRRLTTPYSG
jgi:hypothetical protein